VDQGLLIGLGPTLVIHGGVYLNQWCEWYCDQKNLIFIKFLDIVIY
jgi:hypothetical protein